MRFFNNRPLVITVVIAIVLIVLMIVVPGRLGPLETVGDVVNGGQSFISSGFSAVGNFFGSIFNPSNLEKENAELKEQNAQLERKLQEFDEMARKYEVLKEQMEYEQENPEYKYLSARVIAKDPGYYFDVFSINVGHRQGVKVDDPVITPKGLVGRVIEVSGNTCKVMGIIDSRSSVSCTIERTRDICVVNGGYQLTSESGHCEVEYLPMEAGLLSGDKVVTNSLGSSVFPMGLTVGEIIQVGNPSATTESGRRTLLQPAVDFLHLEDVMVVMQQSDSDDDVVLEQDTDEVPNVDETATPSQDETPTPSNSAMPNGENYYPFGDDEGNTGDGNGGGGDDENNDDSDPNSGDGQ